jgi:hypothetical protein
MVVNQIGAVVIITTSTRKIETNTNSEDQVHHPIQHGSNHPCRNQTNYNNSNSNKNGVDEHEDENGSTTNRMGSSNSSSSSHVSSVSSISLCD